MQTAGFVACVLLHVGIIMFIGIWSFALAMIFSVMIAASRGLGPVMNKLLSELPFKASPRGNPAPIA
ncbi:hypothetical protein J3A64_001610 [Pseudarthrobacter sp. PvP004]|uniref:hypothetical protein n=1 Tax=Pseudarthrobacter sp. PvP004 TaxID=2817850 RepID=UPI001AEAECA6|nr:hypothetical protein [Pseudarthrobacter sp. PvP004]MBP2266146.1 hypothetical protein [Pseudarthrobacter sp. PvP004]